MDGASLGSTPKAVFLDLYGTLLVFPSFDRAHRSWVGAFHELVGRPGGLTMDRMNEICTEMLQSRCERDARHGLTTYETKIRRALHPLGIALSRGELHDLANKTLAVWQDEVPLAEEARDVLQGLKQKVGLVLVSNFDHGPHVTRLLDRLGLTALFSHTVVSDDVGYSKPQPEIFRIALRATGLSAAEVIHVGDSIADDIEGALAAGITPILIDRKLKSHQDYVSARPGDPRAYRIISSLTELLDLIEPVP